jgi:uncharacterized protein
MIAPLTDSAIESALHKVLSRYGPLTIAVSGGVDSMTLAFAAHSYAPDMVSMVHAVSPAVPKAVSARVKDYAERFGWSLTVTDAKEFEDSRYLANPVNRCFFCKSNLYARIQSLFPDATICSGTNTDDLGDYRPGLSAAAERGVQHPYVEANINKAGIRALARGFGLNDLSELPGQPCLSSRIETGLPVTAVDLAFIEMIERLLDEHLGSQSVHRCRVTHAGIIVEASELPIPVLTKIADRCTEANLTFAGVRQYRQGAAFLRLQA